MCEGVESDSPGECPICGMALEPTRAPTIDRKIIYSCKTQPAVAQQEPGECPECGRPLEPQWAASEGLESDPELRMLTSRFWVSALLCLGLAEFRRFIGRSGCSGNDGRRLGRLAFSCSSVAIPGHSQTEHVHSDRDWNDCGVFL